MFRLSKIATICLLMSCFGIADAQTRPAEAPPNQSRARDTSVQEALDKRLPEINFGTVAFVDVISFLRDVTGQNIVVNWKALEREGISRDIQVTARLSDVKFSKVLEVILHEIGGGKVEFGYTVDRGVITISTKKDLKIDLETAIYDVRDLLVAGGRATGREQSGQRLIEAIQRSGGWDPSWTLRELNGQLIVTAPTETQHFVERFIAVRRQFSIEEQKQAQPPP